MSRHKWDESTELVSNFIDFFKYKVQYHKNVFTAVIATANRYLHIHMDKVANNMELDQLNGRMKNNRTPNMLAKIGTKIRNRS